jgi:hypothetical protein
MTQNEKELLLQDICSRLPYGVWIEGKLKDCPFSAKCMLNPRNAGDITLIERGQYDFYKPYLLPRSSMTEEQEEEYKKTTIGTGIFTVWTTSTYDWFNKNHLDYRGLISLGLAIDATNKDIY